MSSKRRTQKQQFLREMRELYIEDRLEKEIESKREELSKIEDEISFFLYQIDKLKKVDSQNEFYSYIEQNLALSQDALEYVRKIRDTLVFKLKKLESCR